MKAITIIILLLVITNLFGDTLITISGESFQGSVIGKQYSDIYFLDHENKITVFNRIDILSVEHKNRNMKFRIYKDRNFLIPAFFNKKTELYYYSYKRIENFDHKELSLYLMQLKQEQSDQHLIERKKDRDINLISWMITIASVITIVIVK